MRLLIALSFFRTNRNSFILRSDCYYRYQGAENVLESAGVAGMEGRSVFCGSVDVRCKYVVDNTREK